MNFFNTVHQRNAFPKNPLGDLGEIASLAVLDEDHPHSAVRLQKIFRPIELAIADPELASSFEERLQVEATAVDRLLESWRS